MHSVGPILASVFWECSTIATQSCLTNSGVFIHRQENLYSVAVELQKRVKLFFWGNIASGRKHNWMSSNPVGRGTSISKRYFYSSLWSFCCAASRLRCRLCQHTLAACVALIAKSQHTCLSPDVSSRSSSCTSSKNLSSFVSPSGPSSCSTSMEVCSSSFFYVARMPDVLLCTSRFL